VLIGAGAIGSHLVPHLARMPEIGRVTTVDPDKYSYANLRAQNIFPCDSGQLKVAVSARRLRTANPRLDVTAIPQRVEEVPWGLLRGDVILACVDSPAARQNINEIACRMGVPWIDSGVLASLMLGRVNVYAPAATTPCLECAWSEEDYKLMEAAYPCGADVAAEPASDTDAALSSMTAAMAAIECQKILRGETHSAVLGRQVTFDVRSYRLSITSYQRRPQCRFDHATWRITPLHCAPRRFTVLQALARTGRIRISGHRFARVLACRKCDFLVEGLHLDRALRCRKCGDRMLSPGFDLLPDLDLSLPDECLNRSLAEIGLRHGDVIDAGDRQFEIVEEVA
jgi:molybdopterin/thiamine biosynthesis adenylyltransferase